MNTLILKLISELNHVCAEHDVSDGAKVHLQDLINTAHEMQALNFEKDARPTVYDKLMHEIQQDEEKAVSLWNFLRYSK